ncbi:alpha/beta-hydrolase [Punctularia strigosozonata HHB-11173 SS5]|uniref:alpha/beta-hydrolase n=1 Tax=Punctularia strigosozonata (strain HHB-11173) TaxID=741275 RepID=UPI0004418187|nr:alpha/beta-hydrolase [Punctularia strigosozonata HHB-11173 SS5]EIN10153.1 alpha/beta-hydrolase [Punctularia strigosozonata HHB-11173 SS5]
MAQKWDVLSRRGIDLAASAASVGFTAAKYGTQLGFSVTRTVATTAASLTGGALDLVLFAGTPSAGPALSSALDSALGFAESLALLPILIGESVTSTSLVAAHSSVNVLAALFPGSDEASFSLASFVTLVRRHWAAEDAKNMHLPEESYGMGEVAAALVAWGALQGVTAEWAEKRWMSAMREIHVANEPHNDEFKRERRESRIRVNSNARMPGSAGHLITADIGDAPTSDGEESPGYMPGGMPAPFRMPVRVASGPHVRFSGVPPSPTTPSSSSAPSDVSWTTTDEPHPMPSPRRMTNDELKSTLRRLSKLVLAGYGGASLLFFGVSPVPPAPSSSASTSTALTRTPITAGPRLDPSSTREEADLASALEASEAEARGSSQHASNSGATAGQNPYSWWNILLGRHDHDIFRAYADAPIERAQQDIRDANASAGTNGEGRERSRTMSVVAGQERLIPRFWVLKDHARKQVVLVIRGTMSLNELAVDLTCEPDDFVPASSDDSDAVKRPRKPQAAHPEASGSQDTDQDDASGEMPGFLASPSRPQRTQTIPVPTEFSAPKPRLRKARSATLPTPSVLHEPKKYKVHGGMLRMMRAMGRHGKPVHVAVRDALRKNKGYELVLCGHSLGAGVAALLGLSWADPKTCLTVRSSGLPVGRRVSVYCFAPPCLTDEALTVLAADMVTSFVYSHDVVSRLSLGSICDIRNAAMWLCDAQSRASSSKKGRGKGHEQTNNVGQRDTKGKGREKEAGSLAPEVKESMGEGYKRVTKRALRFRAGIGSAEDADWFLAIRKTLEANMQHADLFPPGRTWWAIRDGDLHPSNRSTSPAGTGQHAGEKVRLFEVLDARKVFGQIVFAKDMLSSHLPHQYDRVLHELL